MNVQEATNLTITEGEVKAIHDSSNRQLWGRLNYDTTYKGDATQSEGASPSTPQTVNVVTGTQTITLTDGAVSDDYTVTLGSMELVKIGDYQDYIYKSSDGWYIHKAIGKRDVTAIGSIYSSAGSGYIGSQFDVTDMASNSRMNGYCNILIPMNSPSGATTEGITFGAGNKYVYMILESSRMASSTIANWNAWLASNPTIIYYPLATATNTKITDTSLISELNAIHEWLTRYGYTATVAGNLPLIISQTALT